MRVAIVDGDVSYPATSGKRLRTLNLMLQVAKRHDIVYVGRWAPGSVEEREAPAFLKKHNIEPILVPHPVAKKSGLGFYARLAGNLFSSPLPYSVASHYSEPMRQAIRTFAVKSPVDLWQFEWTAYLDMVDADLPGPRVIIGHNVHILIGNGTTEEKSLAKKAFLYSQWKKFDRFERQAFHRATRVVAVSEDYVKLMREKFGQPKVDVVDNGIDRAFFETVERKPDPKQILFLGALIGGPTSTRSIFFWIRSFPKSCSRIPWPACVSLVDIPRRR